MKILRPGKYAWFCDVENRCLNCGTVYRAEARSEVTEVEDKSLGRGVMGFILSSCPTCHATVKTTNPNLLDLADAKRRAEIVP